MVKLEGKLDGKVALITGGSSGIGLATAKRFVGEGAYVFITGRREAELNAATCLYWRSIEWMRRVATYCSSGRAGRPHPRQPRRPA
jgi:NAD(P)-dependent dehydrogenase (short-subunit alcohol dehydrogenase family)